MKRYEVLKRSSLGCPDPQSVGPEKLRWWTHWDLDRWEVRPWVKSKDILPLIFSHRDFRKTRDFKLLKWQCMLSQWV